jgi:hypothetical protein
MLLKGRLERCKETLMLMLEALNSPQDVVIIFLNGVVLIWLKPSIRYYEREYPSDSYGC